MSKSIYKARRRLFNFLVKLGLNIPRLPITTEELQEILRKTRIF